MPESRSLRRPATSLNRPWRALGSLLLAEESRRLVSLRLKEDESRLGGRDPIRRDEELERDGEPVEGTPRLPIVVEARVSRFGLVTSSGTSHIPTADWLRVIRSREDSDGVGGIGGIENVFLRLVGVGGVMPEIMEEPLLDPEPARAPDEDAGRRKPAARDVERLPTSSQA